MEGVVAHQLSHIRRGDALVGAVATVTAAPLASMLPALGAKLTAVLIDGREEPTDAAAVGLTKFPPGLASALEKMRDHPIDRGHPAVDPLWEVPPAVPDSRRGGVLAVLTANRVEDRIQALREL
jgi:Zn-dependent protease with chaperone function